MSHIRVLQTTFCVGQHFLRSRLKCSKLFHNSKKNIIQMISFHTSRRCNDLMEFFEDKKYWNEEKLDCGRPWRKDELRIKSNEDLHKLWYVLLKERNIIMTLEAEFERCGSYMKDVWRMDKVEISMENLLEVVKERDIALNLLETGKSGEPEVKEVRNALGMMYEREEEEHIIPKELNREYQLLHAKKWEPWMGKWIAKYREKLRKDEHFQKKRDEKYIRGLNKYNLTEEEKWEAAEMAREHYRKLKEGEM